MEDLPGLELEEEDAQHVAVLRDIFNSFEGAKSSGKVPVQGLLRKLEELGMEEEDLRNFDERCMVMEQTEVEFGDFIDFFMEDEEEDEDEDGGGGGGGGDDDDEESYHDPSSPTALWKHSGHSARPSPHHATMIYTPRRGKRSSLQRVKSIQIMAAKNAALSPTAAKLGLASPRRLSTRGRVTAEVEHLMRSNKMKRGRIEKAQVLLDAVNRRVEMLQDELSAVDDEDVSHSTREMMWMRKNNEMQAKVQRLKDLIARLQSQDTELGDQLRDQNASIKQLEAEVQVRWSLALLVVGIVGRWSLALLVVGRWLLAVVVVCCLVRRCCCLFLGWFGLVCVCSCFGFSWRSTRLA